VITFPVPMDKIQRENKTVTKRKEPVHGILLSYESPITVLLEFDHTQRII